MFEGLYIFSLCRWHSVMPGTTSCHAKLPGCQGWNHVTPGMTSHHARDNFNIPYPQILYLTVMRVHHFPLWMKWCHGRDDIISCCSLTQDLTMWLCPMSCHRHWHRHRLFLFPRTCFSPAAQLSEVNQNLGPRPTPCHGSGTFDNVAQEAQPSWRTGQAQLSYPSNTHHIIYNIISLT